MVRQELIAARPAPRQPGGPLAWLRRECFGSVSSGLLTLGLLAALWALMPPLLEWSLWQAVWWPREEACQAVSGVGACWGVLVEKYRFILLGRYPVEEQWRPLWASALLLALVVGSALPYCWSRWLLPVWLLVWGLVLVLMGGGVLGLARVPTERWGGLPLTFILSILSIVLACPLAVVLAFGRRSRMPVIRVLCGWYVELVRGVPLISVLFIALSRSTTN